MAVKFQPLGTDQGSRVTWVTALLHFLQCSRKSVSHSNVPDAAQKALSEKPLSSWAQVAAMRLHHSNTMLTQKKILP